MNPQRPFITLQNVSLRLLAGIVFENTDWEIRYGQQWVVLGPNGSGKSSLLKALFGKIPVVCGRILYHFADGGSPGFALESPEKIRHLMSYVSSEHAKIPSIQGSGFYQARWSSFGDDDPLRVSEFVFREPADPSKTGPRRLEAEQASGQLGIDDLLDKKLIALSDGELRRVMIAEALIKRPRLVVLENPFTGLDGANKDKLRNLIQHITQQGVALILATTRAEEIPDSATHVLLVDHHRVAAQGPKDEILQEFLAKAATPAPGAAVPRGSAKVDDVGGPVLLDLEEVCVSYDSKQILNEVSWQVRKGEHWALLGPNGAGKTTLLSLIMGDNPQAYANRITLFGMRRGSGETIWDIKARVGWVSPELHLYYPRRFSCLEVVCSGFFDSIGLHRRVSEGQRRSAEALMTKLGIEHLGENGFKTVSYGEQRLVLLVRALVKKPMLLVLDEPCQGLDDLHRDLFLETVNVLGQQEETTIVFVTHERDELPMVLTHALLLREGKVVAKGRIGEVRRFSRPLADL
jgi:molybdate transport system ATP-binding protein